MYLYTTPSHDADHNPINWQCTK